MRWHLFLKTGSYDNMELSDNFWNWVELHINDGPASLRLKYHGKIDEEIDYAKAITQIECRQKFGRKLADTLSRNPRFYFPAAINGEQATSDVLAAWHASLLQDCNSVLDMTAGLGIDLWHIAAGVHNPYHTGPRLAKAVACEHTSETADALRYNLEGLKLTDVEVLNVDSSEWIKTTDDTFDGIFIDPARRDAEGGRIFAIEDCQPDLKALHSELFRHTSKVVAKLSPMLDVTQVINSLGNVAELYIAGTPTECKELVAVLRKEYTDLCTITAVTLSSVGKLPEFSYTAGSEDSVVPPRYAMPKKGNFMFEPWPAVMKTSARNLLAERYGLKKISANTHVYFADKVNLDAPGQWYEISEVLPYSSSVIKRFKRNWPKGMVAERNFGLSAEVLRKKLGVNDGNEVRIVGVTANDSARYLIIARSI